VIAGIFMVILFLILLSPIWLDIFYGLCTNCGKKGLTHSVSWHFTPNADILFGCPKHEQSFHWISMHEHHLCNKCYDYLCANDPQYEWIRQMIKRNKKS